VTRRKPGTRIAIVGSRSYADLAGVVDYVNALPNDAEVISGGARGVDSTAERAAISRGLKVTSIRAEWEKFGKAAGFIRNSTIVDSCDRVVAFWDGKSRGTLDTITKAKIASKPVEIIR